MSGTSAGTTLLVASTGGHLSELRVLQARFSPALGRVEWATFDTSQSRDLLAGEVVHHVPPVRPKDLPGTWRNLGVARQLLRERQVVRVISTGAAVALPYVLVARRLRVPVHYIESAARTEGPSLTGRLVGAVPGTRLYAQHDWSAGGRRWKQRGSVFDGYDAEDTGPRDIERVVVTFGTQEGYGFRRAAARIVELLPQIASRDAAVVWQVGDTDVSGLGVDARHSLPYDEMRQEIAKADLVVSHAGVGSALLSLELGKIPVLIPRERAHHEHTDDHQSQIAADLADRGLAVSSPVADLEATHLTTASRRAPVMVPAPAYVLDEE
jgi:UDP-N-acetylglucosamine--N-acetylmuramyl-(pentapeptide) pyrophosphoryl-undecaprenol N-acetylglucosamine transferase